MTTPSLLVATDFSDLSRRALRAAEQWTGVLGGSVTPIHAYEPATSLDGFHFYGPGATVSGTLAEIAREVERELGEFAKKEVDPSRLKEGVFVAGSTAQSIARASLEHDLLVLSSHGRSGFSRFFLGSVADKVVRLAPGPVLLVHEEPELSPLGRIVVPTDLSPNSAAAFPLALELARATGAAVELVHVHVSDSTRVTSTQALEEAVHAFAAPHLGDALDRGDITVLVTGAAVQDALAWILREKRAGLVVMASVGRSGVEHQLLGEAPAHVIRAVRTPALLVTPDGEQAAKREALKAS